MSNEPCNSFRAQLTGALGTDILRRTPRFLRFGARLALGKLGMVYNKIIYRHRGFSNSVPGGHEPNKFKFEPCSLFREFCDRVHQISA